MSIDYTFDTHTHKHSENAVLANPSKKDSLAVTKKAVLDGINSMCVVIDQRLVHKVIYRERKLSCHINYCLMKCGVSKNTIKLMFGSHLKFQFYLEHNPYLDKSGSSLYRLNFTALDYNMTCWCGGWWYSMWFSPHSHAHQIIWEPYLLVNKWFDSWPTFRSIVNSMNPLPLAQMNKLFTIFWQTNQKSFQYNARLSETHLKTTYCFVTS